MVDIARETVLKVFKMCNMCLSGLYMRKRERGSRVTERERKKEKEKKLIEKTRDCGGDFNHLVKSCVKTVWIVIFIK